MALGVGLLLGDLKPPFRVAELVPVVVGCLGESPTSGGRVGVDRGERAEALGLPAAGPAASA